MKQIIRLNTFETNSSSTHSLCICTKKEYDDFVQGKLYFSGFNDEFVTKTEVIKGYEEACREFDDDLSFNEWLDDQDIYTHEGLNDSYYEAFAKTYTTPNGDEIVVLLLKE